MNRALVLATRDWESRAALLAGTVGVGMLCRTVEHFGGRDWSQLPVAAAELYSYFVAPALLTLLGIRLIHAGPSTPWLLARPVSRLEHWGLHALSDLAFAFLALQLGVWVCGAGPYMPHALASFTHPFMVSTGVLLYLAAATMASSSGWVGAMIGAGVGAALVFILVQLIEFGLGTAANAIGLGHRGNAPAEWHLFSALTTRSVALWLALLPQLRLAARSGATRLHWRRRLRTGSWAVPAVALWTLVANLGGYPAAPPWSRLGETTLKVHNVRAPLKRDGGWLGTLQPTTTWTRGWAQQHSRSTGHTLLRVGTWDGEAALFSHVAPGGPYHLCAYTPAGHSCTDVTIPDVEVHEVRLPDPTKRRER